MAALTGVTFVILPDSSEYFNMNAVVRIVPQADGTARFYYTGGEFFAKSYGANLAAAQAGVTALVGSNAL
jgi:hypothetical protein